MAIAALRSIINKRLIQIVTTDATVYDNADQEKIRSMTLHTLDVARDKVESATAHNKSFGDLPELVIAYGDADLEDFADRARYGYGTGAAGTGVVCEFAQQFTLTLTFKHARSPKNDTLAIALLETLHAAGPSLGLAPGTLPYVMRGRVAMRNAYGFVTRPMTGRPETTERQQTTYTFPVTVRWKGSTFPTQTI